MRSLLLVLFSGIGYVLQAQTEPLIKYYDTSGSSTTKEKADFYAKFEKQGAVYKVTTYYAKSDKLFGTSTFGDTLFQKGIGTMLRYHETGELMDSSIYDAQGFKRAEYTFRKNGKMLTRTINNRATNSSRIEAFDEDGKLDPKATIIGIAAEFKGGIYGWQEYLEKNLKGNTPVKNKAPAGRYTVQLSFTVDEDGRLSDILALNDPGYGTKEEALRVLEKSPKWTPATKNGKPVVYRHKQSITFEVSEK